jgi:hypothetical protein
MMRDPLNLRMEPFTGFNQAERCPLDEIMSGGHERSRA